MARIFGPALGLAAGLCLIVGLSGCAEVNRRGGVLAGFGDHVLFPANTKSHRLLRAYVVIGALTAVARNAGLAEIEKDSMSGRLKAALSVAQEAYECLYPTRARVQWIDSKDLPAYVSKEEPVGCIFFDERMARLNYALYKLAADILLDPDSQSLFADVRDRLIGNVPVVGSAIRTATKALEATEEATAVVHESLSLANSIIRLSFVSSRRYIYLAPIYRDALELDMRLVIHALEENCYGSNATAECQKAIADGKLLLDDARGDLSDWRTYLETAPAAISTNGRPLLVHAYPIHFAVVTRWLFRSCVTVFAGDILAPGKAKITSTGTASTDRLAGVVAVAEETVNDKCSPLIEYKAITNDPVFKVAYRPPANGTEPRPGESFNVMRRLPAPVVRPAQAIDPGLADKARGEAK